MTFLISIGLIETQLPITRMQKHIIIVHKNGLEANTLITNSILVGTFLTLIEGTETYDISQIKLGTSMQEQ